MADSQSAAWPVADGELTNQITDVVQQALHLKSIRKGANEVTKALNRGTAELVILSADTKPLEILLHIPLICEDKNVPYVYVKSRAALGRAVGISRQVIAVAIVNTANADRTELRTNVEKISDKITRLMI